MAFLKYRGSTITPGTWSANAAAGAPLTNLDIDKNFASLDAQKLDLSGGTISGALAIGQNLTAEFKDDLVVFVDGADTSKKLALQLSSITPSTTRTLTVPNNDGTIALTSDLGNGALTISDVSAAATNNSVTLTLSGAYSANTSTARTLDLKVGPALTALAALMTTAGAGFIRRGATADTYAIDTNTYSTTSHGHFIGTTAVQSSAANQALTGITGLSSPNDISLSSNVLITSGLGTAASSISGGVTITTGSTNGTVATGGSTGVLRLQTGTAGTNGAAGSIIIEAGLTAGSSGNNGIIGIYGGNSSNGTFSDNGHIYIRAGSAQSATGTKSGGKVWIDGGRPLAGGTVVDDGQVNIGTGNGGPGGPGTTLVNIGHDSSTTNIRGTLVVAGNLTINGTTTTVNSNTLSVDDKNIELGAVGSANFNATGNIAAGSTVITALSSTANIIPGSLIAAASGVASVGIPASLLVVSVDSPTQITVNQALTGSGTATAILTFSGATDATANGGGITLKGATDKTILWDSTNSNWTLSENLNIATNKVFKINNATVLNATTLGGAVVNSSLTKLGTVAGFVKSDASGNLSADTSTYLSGTVTIASGGTNITAYTSGDILYASNTNILSKLAKGNDGQVLKLVSGLPSWATDADTQYTLPTATSTVKGGIELFSDTVQDTAASAVSTTTSRTYGIQLNADGQAVVNVPWVNTDTDTTYSASTGLTLTGTAFSVSYGNTATTACAGNDTRLSDARAANGGTATNANNVYVGQTNNTLNYDYPLLLTAGVDQNIALKADASGGPTYNPLRNGVCLNGFASHVWAYTALQMGRDWSISQDAYSYSFAAGCKASTASAWTGTGNLSKAMRFSLDANYGAFYWYVKPTDTTDTTTAISFRTTMSLDIDGNLSTFGGITAGNYLSVNGTGVFTQSVTLPSINAATGTLLTITGAPTAATGAPAHAVDVIGGLGGSSAVASIGGAINITGGRSGYNSTGTGGGGAVNITGGGGNALGASGVPGAVNITAGTTAAAGQAGASINISATGGNGIGGASANGGNVVIKSGPGTSSGGNSGSVTIAAPGDSGGTRPSVIINVGGTGDGTYIAKFVGNGLSVGTASNPDAAGSILAAGNITAYSDERLKTNITKIDNALNKVQQLNGYTFDRIDIEGSRQTGVIAQEVLKVLPEAVFGTEDSTYSVAYGNMIGLMIEAIKELNAKVEDLQNQLMNK